MLQCVGFEECMKMAEAEQETLAGIRREYLQDALRRADLVRDPVEQFHVWLGEAREAGVEDATAMNLGTVDPEGRPSSRTVLLKGADEEGFRFFTCLGSRKASELQGNPAVALHFFWARLSRQVAVRGRAVKLPRAQCAEYFSSRPRESQLAAWASCQSAEVGGRQELEQDFLDCESKFDGGDVPMPPDWGGYLVVPGCFEFWQGRPGRLHDRFVYEPDGLGGWGISRLAP